MSKHGKDHILIPALVAAAAAYFGFKKKSENISEIAKTLVNRAIKDQTRTNHQDNQKRQLPPVRKDRRRKRAVSRKYHDRYYS